MIAPPKGEDRATPWGVMLKPVKRQVIKETVTKEERGKIKLDLKNTKVLNKSNAAYKTSFKKKGSDTSMDIPMIEITKSKKVTEDSVALFGY